MWRLAADASDFLEATESSSSASSVILLSFGTGISSRLTMGLSYKASPTSSSKLLLDRFISLSAYPTSARVIANDKHATKKSLNQNGGLTSISDQNVKKKQHSQKNPNFMCCHTFSMGEKKTKFRI